MATGPNVPLERQHVLDSRLSTVKHSIERVFPLEGQPERTEVIEKPRLSELPFIDDVGGKRWNEITLETLVKYHDIPPILSPTAFRYLLPAFMTATLNYETNDLLPSLLFYLTPPRKTDHNYSFYVDQMQGLSLEQRVVIRSYIELTIHLFNEPDAMLEKNQIKRLRSYWKDFRPIPSADV